MDPEKLKNLSPENMMQQAQQIWKMLDDMAESDPGAYKNFIDKQMQEGKETMKPPEPHMCIQSKILKPGQGMLFINLFEWVRVPEPKTDEDPIPVMGSVMYKGKDDSGIYDIINVAVCPKVTSEFGIDSDLVEERNLLINLAIDYIQDQHKLTISRHYTLLNKEFRYKGTLAKALETLTKKMNTHDKQYEKELSELEKNLGSMAVGAKDSLLNQLSNIGISDSKDKEEQYVPDDPPLKQAMKEPEIKFPGNLLNNTKPGLVQEVGVSGQNSTFASSGDDHKKSGLIQEVGASTTSLPEPVYVLEETEGECKMLKIMLPGVSSVSECDLDISENDLHLVVEGKYELKLDFKCKINQNSAKAKFSRKSSQLKLTIPYLTGGQVTAD